MSMPVARRLALLFMGAALLLPAAASALSPWALFFDSGSSRLSAQAEKILDYVAQAVRESDIRKLAISGHADRVGSAEANRALGLKRAEAVKAALVRRGVPAGMMTVETWGEERPIVQTADGVAELQNRFVFVTILVMCRGPSAFAPSPGC